MKKALFLPLLFLLLYGSTAAQKTEGPIVCRATVEGKDTILLFDLKPYNVIDFKGNLSQKEIRRKTRLMNNIIRVYPYARMAAVKLREYDSLLVSIPNDEQRKKTM